MSGISVLQAKLALTLEQHVPALQGYDRFAFFRTRKKNPEAAKWVFTAHFPGKKKVIEVMSVVPARDLVSGANKVVVLKTEGQQIWVGYQKNVDALLVALQASPLWVPRVQKAIERTLSELGST